MAAFSNIIPPTRHGPQALEDEQRWKLLSHIHVNLMPVLNSKTLKETLLLHGISQDPDAGRSLANIKRIDALQDLKIESEDWFFQGRPIRGSRIELTADVGGFGSLGDRHIFGDSLDRFFGLFHHINTYTRLKITEKNSREELLWPPRLGTRRLI
jgi:type VI secretion system protein ImpG